MAKGRDINQTEQNLINYGKNKKDSLKRKIQKKKKEEISKYSFRPAILQNKINCKDMKSEEIENGKKSEKGIQKVHKKLYEYAERQRKTKEWVRAQPECSFTPDLRSSRKQAKSELFS